MAAASPQSPRQLPRGRHGLSPAAIESDQRGRLLVAISLALEEHGYAGTTVARVIQGARVSRRTFYDQFADKDDCLLAAYEEAERRAWERAVAAAEAAQKDWPQCVHATLGAVLDFLAAESATARLFTLEARAALPEIARRHRCVLDRATMALHTGNRTRPGGPADLPEGTEATLVGNVVALVGAYVLSGATELLPGLAPQLADHLLLPYTEAEGAGAA